MEISERKLDTMVKTLCKQLDKMDLEPEQAIDFLAHGMLTHINLLGQIVADYSEGDQAAAVYAMLEAHAKATLKIMALHQCPECEEGVH